MPTYEYECAACGARFTRFESIAQHSQGERQPAPPPCPTCRSPDTHRVFSAFFAKTIRKS